MIYSFDRNYLVRYVRYLVALYRMPFPGNRETTRRRLAASPTVEKVGAAAAILMAVVEVAAAGVGVEAERTRTITG